MEDKRFWVITKENSKEFSKMPIKDRVYLILLMVFLGLVWMIVWPPQMIAKLFSKPI